jgi:hypothetical protein
MSTNTAEIRVGRLLEVRIAAGYRSVDDVDQLFDALDGAVSALPPGVKHVTVADWTRCAVMTPTATARLRERMALTNVHTERSAVLVVPDMPTAVVQFLRVIREAKLPDRKLFFSASELVTFLAEVLTPAETERVRQFFTERPGPSRPAR